MTFRQAQLTGKLSQRRAQRSNSVLKQRSFQKLSEFRVRLRFRKWTGDWFQAAEPEMPKDHGPRWTACWLQLNPGHTEVCTLQSLTKEMHLQLSRNVFDSDVQLPQICRKSFSDPCSGKLESSFSVTCELSRDQARRNSHRMELTSSTGMGKNEQASGGRGRTPTAVG